MRGDAENTEGHIRIDSLIMASRRGSARWQWYVEALSRNSLRSAYM